MAPETNTTGRAPAPEREVGSIVIDSLIEAAWRAFILMILGNIAVSLVSGIFHDMTPSLPPGFGGAEVEAHSGHARWHWSSQWLHRTAFFPIFGVLSAGIIWARLRPAPADPKTSRGYRRWQRIQRVLREEWFGLFVWNAFGAMIAAMIAVWLQRFSSVQWLLDVVFGLIGPPLHQLIGSIFGEGATQRVDAWFSWYGQNQPKFTFWLIYFASICDDLGIPNVKTLGRWLWRRARTWMSGQQRQSGTAS
jgi:hypothetical protein